MVLAFLIIPRQTMEWIGLLFVAVISVGGTMAAIPIRIESIVCTGDEVYSAELACSVETIRKKMQVLNFDCTFPEELDNLMIKFTLFKKDGATYKHFLIDSTEDLCKVLDKTERSNVVSRMMPMWRNYGTFPDRCPTKGKISVRRYPLDLSFYPTTFPSGDFMIKLQIFETKNNTSILNVTTTFNVKYA